MDAVFSFSTAPAEFVGVFGLLFCALAFISLLVIFVRALLFGDPVAGWPSTICFILMIGGLQLFCLGIIAQYVSKTYAEVKHRPIYICKETNLENQEDEDQE